MRRKAAAPLFATELVRVARARPRAVALEGARSVSYGELLARADALAGTLRARGIGPGSLVALAFGGVPEHVIALAGVWRAGAAWMPLDPEWPRARRDALVEDAGAVAVLDAAGLSKRRGVRGERAAAGADDLAYVIYTSGSTGRPKGVEVTHRGLVPLLRAQIRAFKIDRASRCLAYLSTVFDASLSDIGTALLAGATLCFDPEARRLAPRELLARLGERGITHADLPPALLARLPAQACPPCLRTIVIGGEPCPIETVRAWAPRVRLVNVYGPTEATICTSLGACAENWSRPLLGRPVAGMRYAVVGAELAPVPAGKPGELLIAGPGLARGYRGDPELTRARFVTHGGTRWYRTGDRVLRHPDGGHEFLGRLDRQLKLNGYRIQPEEIEACLAAHPRVARVAVIPRRVGAREALVAFVVLHAGEAHDAAELPRHAGRALPRWMVPARFEIVDALPVLASGKVDARALAGRPLRKPASPVRRTRPEKVAPPALQGTAVAVRRFSSHSAPHSPTARLRAILAGVLGLDDVSAADDFFALGGDSLGALEVVARARAAGLDLAPSWMEAPATARGLARRLSRAARTASPESVPAAELRRRVAFGPAWRARLDRAARRPSAPDAPPAHLLITGATGFLGARVLRELLVRTDARVTCLVRARGDAEARARLGGALPARVTVLAGDLRHPRLGLPRAVHDRLAADVDTIVHCAAEVHASRPYRALAASNVGGARALLGLMARGRPKRLHHASTLSVFVATDHAGTAREDDHLAATGHVWGGYAQTKWAAEVLLRAAGGRAGPVVHHRFGLLTGDTVTGESPARDLFALLVRAVAAAGCVPAGAPAELALDVTPVDYAAAAMAQLIAAAPARDGVTYHIANARPLRLGGLVAAMRAAGVSVERVPRTEWERRVGGLPHGAWLPLVRALGDARDLDRLRGLDLFCATGARFDTARTRAGLAGSGLACPPPDRRLIARYVRAVLAREAR